MALIATFVLFILLFLGLRKKIDLRILLLALTLIGTIYLAITNPGFMGENTSGSPWTDCFGFITDFMSSSIGGIVLTIMLVFAYLDVLGKIKSLDALAYLLKKPLSKIKNPYLLVVVIAFVEYMLKICFSISPVEAALCCSMFFPIMLACGCTVETAAVTMLLPLVMNWGPADTNSLTAMGLMDINVDMTEFFVGTHLPIGGICLVVLLILMVLVSMIFDKRHPSEKKVEVTLSEKPDVPMFYAIMPLLPVILVLIFSPLVINGVSMSVPTACIVSLLISLIIVLITKRKLKELSTLFVDYFVALGDNLKSIGLMVLFATMFASMLNKIGGMNVIAEAMLKLRIPALLLTLLLCILAGLINMIVGSFYGSLSIAMPIAASVLPATGLSAPVLCFLVLLALNVGCLCSPVNPIMLVVSQRCNVEIPTLIKRGAPILWPMLIIVVVISALVL